MRSLLVLFVIAIILVSCKEGENQKHYNPYSEYFFPYDSSAVVYAYRDQVGGMEEQFKRIYGVTDSRGTHIVIETYVDGTRLRDALNFSADSLILVDHMVVDGKGQKIAAELFKQDYFPSNDKDEFWFASRFPGFYDSTFILQEHKTKMLNGKVVKEDVLGKNTEVIKTQEHIRWTLFNPIKKTENVIEVDQISHYAKGIGLVEYYDKDKNAHYKLEKIYTQKEWVNITK